MSKYLKFLFLFLLILCSINFFEPKFLEDTPVRYFRYLYLIFSIGISIPFMFSKRGGFVLPVQLISIAIIISIIFAHFDWKQSWFDSFIATSPFLLWPVFFYLKHLKFSIETIETLVVIFGILYIILYVFQFTHSETVKFGINDEFDQSRGIARIVLPGNGLLILSIFIALSKSSVKNSHRWFWLSLLLVGSIIIILQVTRQYIIVLLIMILFHFIKSQSSYKKIFIISFFVGVLFYLAQSDIKLVSGLKNAQIETLKEGRDYIRIQSGIFFMTQFSPYGINQILGNGAPYLGKSNYGNYVQRLFEVSAMDMSDVGLIGFYVQFGFLAVFGFILIWIRSFTIKLPDNYFYLKYYLWFLLFTSLTSAALYTQSFLMANILVLYCYQIVYEIIKKV